MVCLICRLPPLTSRLVRCLLYTSRRHEVARKLYLLGKSTILDLNASVTEKDSASRNFLYALSNYWNLYYMLRSIDVYKRQTLGRSLPVAGKDGGLSGYCIGATALKGRMQAKTGSMSGVRCLAGYLTTTGNERMAFTVLINHYTCTASQLQKAVGKFLQSLLSY